MMTNAMKDMVEIHIITYREKTPESEAGIRQELDDFGKAAFLLDSSPVFGWGQKAQQKLWYEKSGPLFCRQSAGFARRGPAALSAVDLIAGFLY
jgi:hypothetical protein